MSANVVRIKNMHSKVRNLIKLVKKMAIWNTDNMEENFRNKYRSIPMMGHIFYDVYSKEKEKKKKKKKKKDK